MYMYEYDYYILYNIPRSNPKELFWHFILTTMFLLGLLPKIYIWKLQFDGPGNSFMITRGDDMYWTLN